MNDFAKVSELIADFQRRLQVVVKRDGARAMQDMHIPLDLFALIEDELLPVLEQCIDSIEYDPTPEHLWDNHGGEPPVTQSALHEIARAFHVGMHS